MTPVIKLLRAAEWAQFQADGVFAGSPDDLRDGFIHLSTPEQAPGTAAKWFAGEAGVMALTFDADALAADLKWEPSRGGKLFPHLYRSLRTEEIVSAVVYQ
ncbi:MAG: DUF952 domain-containing protein [Sandarakinorhabdus sp.]|jgi:uncharacterized protein (DUF952 family)|nr:DUF952 domain-containing protein [Sandarakinorhabdus sp.]